MRLIIGLVLLAQHVFSTNLPVMSEVRRLYFRLDTDRSAATKIQELTFEGVVQNNPLMKAYYAVATANTAQNLVLPMSKYNRFREGRNLLEQAIASEPNNPELRFLRLSMQHKTPALLNYRSDIDQDVNIVLNFLENDLTNVIHPGSYWHNVLLFLQQMNHGKTEVSGRIERLMKKFQLK